MSLVTRLSFNLRQVIFSYLSFSEIRTLFFLNKKLSLEISIYLNDNLLSIKQTDIFRLNKFDLSIFLKKFKNITQIQLNCLKIDLFYVMPSLPKKLKSLKFIDIKVEDLYNENFWEILSVNSFNLEYIGLTIQNNCLKEQNFIENNNNFFKFIESHPNLKKIAFKFPRNFSMMSFYFFDIILETLVKVPNKINYLVFHNIRTSKYFSEQNKIVCPNIREIKIRNENPDCEIGVNFQTLKYFSGIFPKLESFHILDYCTTGSLTNNSSGFHIFASNYMRKQIISLEEKNKEIIPTLKNFNLNCYGLNIEIDELSMMNFLSNCNDLRSFGCSSNKFLSSSIIQELVMRNMNLIQLNVDYTNFDDLSCQIVANSPIIKNLKKLSLQFCKRITFEGFACLLGNCKSLKSLNVKGNKNFKNKLVDYLLESGEIEELFLHQNRIKNDNVHKIVKKFRGSLKILEISKLEFYEKFTNAIFKELSDENYQLSKVKILDISFNHIIDDKCMFSICKVFCNLESFNVKCCGHFNMICFDHMKASNWKYTLEKLNIKYCYFFRDQIETILNILHNFQKLLFIYIEETLLNKTTMLDKRFIIR